jgi:hypothetical protein
LENVVQLKLLLMYLLLLLLQAVLHVIVVQNRVHARVQHHLHPNVPNAHHARIALNLIQQNGY